MRLKASVKFSLRPMSSSLSCTKPTARAACLASRALPPSGISVRSARMMAREARRLAVPSRSTKTNCASAAAVLMRSRILPSVASLMTLIGRLLFPVRQSVIGLLGSASMIVTDPPC